MDYSAKAFIRDSDGNKVFAMEDSAKALIRDSDGSKVFAWMLRMTVRARPPPWMGTRPWAPPGPRLLPLLRLE